MVDTFQRDQQNGFEEQPGRTTGQPAEQTGLFKLAERAVVQAETLAIEIIELAKVESEAESVRLKAQYQEEAKEEARRIIEAADKRSVASIKEARDKAQAESEETYCKAQAEAQEIVNEAQTERQEVLGKAQKEALAIVSAAKSRAASMESNASLKAEFSIRQMRQKVADAIQNVVMEMCGNSLPGKSEQGNQAPNTHFAGLEDSDPLVENGSMANHGHSESNADYQAMAEMNFAMGTKAPDKPSAKNKARPSAGSKAKTSGKK